MALMYPAAREASFALRLWAFGHLCSDDVSRSSIPLTHGPARSTTSSQVPHRGRPRFESCRSPEQAVPGSAPPSRRLGRLSRPCSTSDRGPASTGSPLRCPQGQARSCQGVGGSALAYSGRRPLQRGSAARPSPPGARARVRRSSSLTSPKSFARSSTCFSSSMTLAPKSELAVAVRALKCRDPPRIERKTEGS